MQDNQISSSSSASSFADNTKNVITAEKVRHIAHLSRIGLKESELLKFQTQLQSIMGYMEILNEVDTSSVKETTQITGLQSVMREDILRGDVTHGDELLECSPLAKTNHQIAVKAIIKE